MKNVCLRRAGEVLGRGVPGRGGSGDWGNVALESQERLSGAGDI